MSELMVIEHVGQRVLTTAQIAEKFGTDVERITVNFNRNKDKFVSRVHYFLLEGETLREFKTGYHFDTQLKHARSIYLWTEKGAWLLAKTINTDQAWFAYRSLIDDYYSIKTTLAPLSKDQALAAVLRTTADLLGGQQEIRDLVTVHDQEIKEIKSMVEEQLTLNYRQQRVLQKAISRRVYSLTSDPRDRKEFFKQIHREIKDRWAVPSYTDVPTVELEQVLRYVEAWRPILVGAGA